MDPITHSIIGMSVSKMVGQDLSLSNPMTAAIVVGSVIPDIDIVLQKWGHYIYLKNHRGITHSIPGIVGLSAIITGAIALIYGNVNLFYIFIGALLGNLSHVFIDIFNLYGAKVFWPITKRKISFNLLGSFDPIVVGLLSLYTISNFATSNLFLVSAALYILGRAFTKKWLTNVFKRRFGEIYVKVNLIPAMTNIFKWIFILETKESKIIGDINFFLKTLRVKRVLNKVNDDSIDKILYTKIGMFFTEFTHHYHVDVRNCGNNKRYIFTDLRYFLKGEFLHHAVVELDSKGNVIESTFNPYSFKTSIKIN